MQRLIIYWEANSVDNSIRVMGKRLRWNIFSIGSCWFVEWVSSEMLKWSWAKDIYILFLLIKQSSCGPNTKIVYKFFYSDNTSDLLYCKIQGEGGVSLSRLAFSHVYECEGITELQIVAGLLVVTQASISVCLFGFLQVLQVLPRVQKHIHQIDWRLKIVPQCVWISAIRLVMDCTAMSPVWQTYWPNLIPCQV